MQKLVFVNGAGTQIDLTAGNFGITNWEGFSNTGLNIQTQQVPFEDGAVFLDALMEQRELAVTVAIYDGNNLELRYQKKRELISALNPKLGEGTLIYTNDYLSKQIKAVPQIPLFENKNSNDAGTLKASVTFSCPNPYWEDLEETEVTFGVSEHISVNNSGDVPCQMKLDFLTTGVTNPQILRDDNKYIKYNGHLTDNLNINTEVGQKSVTAERFNFELTGITSINNEVNGMCYSEKLKLLFVISSWGLVYTSKDGKTFNTFSVNCRCTGCCIGRDGEFWVIGEKRTGGDYVCAYRSTDGVNFTLAKSFTDIRTVNDIAYSPTLDMLYVTSSGTDYYSYNNGSTWESTDGAYWHKLIWAEDRFISSTGSYSFDGIHWSSGNFEEPIQGENVIYAKGMYLIIGKTTWGESKLCICKSTDCENWSIAYEEDVNITVFNICYSPLYEKFYVAKYGNRTDNPIVIMESSDGENWSDIKNTDIVGYSTAFFYWEERGLFLLGVANLYVGITVDDIAPVFSEFTSDCYALCYSKKHKLFVNGGYQFIAVSEDGTSWSKVCTTAWSIRKIIYSEEKDLFIAVGDYLTIYTSADGINWTERNISESSRSLNSIAEGNGLLIAVGDFSTILKSTDGIEWQSESIEQENIQLSDIIYVGNKFYIVGFYQIDYYSLLFTRDGEGNWTSVTVNNILFKKLVYNNITNKIYLWGNNNVYSTDLETLNPVYVSDTVEGNNFIFIKDLGMFVIPIEQGFYISYDSINWGVIYFGSSDWEYNDVVYAEGYFVIVGEAVFVSRFVLNENLIQNISEGSDMGLNIEVGENEFRLIKSQGNFTCRIRYRQKYIGV